ncbi:MAG: hypothetical protein BWY59_01780 [Verrucomicrobia bacterium ADurb.Bin345]|nr:MAG: hypothetical protein BWY59_01780 [Verrucomicrobia bacterium ADurb.Bin345]
MARPGAHRRHHQFGEIRSPLHGLWRCGRGRGAGRRVLRRHRDIQGRRADGNGYRCETDAHLHRLLRWVRQQQRSGHLLRRGHAGRRVRECAAGRGPLQQSSRRSGGRGGGAGRGRHSAGGISAAQCLRLRGRRHQPGELSVQHRADGRGLAVPRVLQRRGHDAHEQRARVRTRRGGAGLDGAGPVPVLRAILAHGSRIGRGTGHQYAVFRFRRTRQQQRRVRRRAVCLASHVRRRLAAQPVAETPGDALRRAVADLVAHRFRREPFGIRPLARQVLRAAHGGYQRWIVQRQGAEDRAGMQRSGAHESRVPLAGDPHGVGDGRGEPWPRGLSELHVPGPQRGLPALRLEIRAAGPRQLVRAAGAARQRDHRADRPFRPAGWRLEPALLRGIPFCVAERRFRGPVHFRGRLEGFCSRPRVLFRRLQDRAPVRHERVRRTEIPGHHRDPRQRLFPHDGLRRRDGRQLPPGLRGHLRRAPVQGGRAADPGGLREPGGEDERDQPRPAGRQLREDLHARALQDQPVVHGRPGLRRAFRPGPGGQRGRVFRGGKRPLREPRGGAGGTRPAQRVRAGEHVLARRHGNQRRVRRSRPRRHHGQSLRRRVDHALLHEPADEHLPPEAERVPEQRRDVHHAAGPGRPVLRVQHRGAVPEGQHVRDHDAERRGPRPFARRLRAEHDLGDQRQHRHRVSRQRGPREGRTGARAVPLSQHVLARRDDSRPECARRRGWLEQRDLPDRVPGDGWRRPSAARQPVLRQRPGGRLDLDQRGATAPDPDRHAQAGV